MKKIKKIISIMLVAVMALAMSMTAFAQTVPKEPKDSDNATITINNPAKGETYSLYKLFDATYSGKAIAYQSKDDIPTELAVFFTKDESDNVSPVESILEKDEDGKVTGTKMTDELEAALEKWAASATAIVTEESDGSVLNFTGLPYGYYVMTTTHKDQTTAKSMITVESAHPNASIRDKNESTVTVKKEVEKDSYSIGDTVKYTATFGTTNYLTKKNEKDEKEDFQVVKYVISDTLPDFLEDVKVTKIKVVEGEGETAKETVIYAEDGESAPQFDADKKIVIDWVEAKGSHKNYKNKYAQGAKIVMEYEAILTSVTKINADDVNTVSIMPYVDDGENPGPWSEPFSDQAKIRTYAAAIKKVDQDGNALAGAQFTIAGLEAEQVKDEAGVYKVKTFDPTSTTAGTVMSTDEEGNLYIVGLAEDAKPVVTEYKAPDGYNKLTETKELPVQVLSEEIHETTGTRYYDSDNNLLKEESEDSTTKTIDRNLDKLNVNEDAVLIIENKQGTLLPSTGGIGTTIFYIVGAILVIGAGIILVAKKRMSHEQ